MYDKAYFLARFQEFDTDALLLRYVSGNLTDVAKEATLEVLNQRNIPPEKLESLMHQARKATYRQTRGSTRCDYCGASARFSPVYDDQQRFCSKACLTNMRLMEVSVDIPEDTIVEHARAIQNSRCPCCQQSAGALEVRKYHRIWSALLLTQWSTQKTICCAPCGKRKALRSIGFCLALGWWGFPWGIVMTPIQILCNLAELFKKDERKAPSDALINAARLDLAARQQAASAASTRPA